MTYYWPPTTAPATLLDGYTASPNEPAGPVDGDVWVDLGSGQMKVWLFGQWRPVGFETAVPDRYGAAASSLPGLTQQAAGTTDLFGTVTATLPGMTTSATGTVAVTDVDGGTPDSTPTSFIDGGPPDASHSQTLDGGSP